MTTTDQSTAEEKKYIVKFFDAVSGWLHSTHDVSVTDPADARQTALDSVKEKTGEDLSVHKASITDAETGHGVPDLTVVTNEDSLAAQQKQIDELRAELKRVTSQPVPASVNEVRVTNPPAPASEVPGAPVLVPVAEQKAAGVPPEATVSIADQKAGKPAPSAVIPPAPTSS